MGRLFFIGYCWGAAGSAWLARLLNSHEDIFCVQAPVLNRYDHFQFADSTELLNAIFTAMSFGGGYPVAGVTHGVPLEWHPKLVKKYGGRMRNFTLIRSPIERIQSSAKKIAQGYAGEAEKYIMADGCQRVFRKLRETAKGDFPNDPASLGFYNSCDMVNSIIQETDHEFPVFKLEDLVAQTNEVQRLLAHISDGTCRLEDRIIRKLQQTVINKRSEKRLTPKEIYDSWNGNYRAAFHCLVNPLALEIYRRLGYDLPVES